ncbi:MAG: TrkH family potassium uptake protein [Thermotogaceae bacterium]|nr:TrkH family potassium uptake protein [Thermotogaceae bacterium]
MYPAGDYVTVLKRRYRVTLWNLGSLFLWFSLLILFPVIFVIFYPEELHNGLYFVYAAVISALLGYFLQVTSRIKKEEASLVTIQEGAVIVLFSWIGVIMLSSLPFVFARILNFSQAIFETTSGWTTTGLTVVDVTKVSKLFLVWRSVMQYVGGAGFAVIMVGSIIGPGGFGLYSAEGRTDNILPNIKDSAKMIMVMYLTYAVAGMVAYILVGMPPFDAFNHSLTALATGGFSTRAGSIGEFNSFPIEVVTIILMFTGATGFGIHYTLWKGNFKAFVKNGEPWLMFSTVAVTASVVYAKGIHVVFNDKLSAFRDSLFQTVSALTGTGFSTVDFTTNNWPMFSTGMFILTVLMILGGMMDSTSGGLKQFRLFVTLRLIVEAVIKFVSPRSRVREIVVWKGDKPKVVDGSMTKEILLVFSLYFTTYFTGVTILTLYGYSLQNAMFEFASALSGVGLSCGIVQPDMPLGAMWTLTFGMFLGRLEFLVVIYSISKLIRDAMFVMSRR